MATDRQFRWMMTGLAILASVTCGVLIGEQASAEMEPFYAKVVAPTLRHHDDPVIVADSGTGNWSAVPDFGYSRAQEMSAADPR